MSNRHPVPQRLLFWSTYRKRGKLSENTSLRAKIFDTNIPIQQNGYSQNLTDFDRIFIEMYSKNWRVKAGDIALENTESMFMPINKQIAGLQVEANINENFKIALEYN